MSTNPRSKNGALRRKHRARLRAIGAECAICKGRFGPIRYDQPADGKHPLAFVIDEKIPVSRWKEFGYRSPEAVAQDWNNLQAAHYYCNRQKSDKLNFDITKDKLKDGRKTLPSLSDGDW